jgi:hypothetical protein
MRTVLKSINTLLLLVAVGLAVAIPLAGVFGWGVEHWLCVGLMFLAVVTMFIAARLDEMP